MKSLIIPPSRATFHSSSAMITGGTSSSATPTLLELCSPLPIASFINTPPRNPKLQFRDPPSDGANRRPLHTIPQKYREYLIRNSHQNPDGMPAIPVYPTPVKTIRPSTPPLPNDPQEWTPESHIALMKSLSISSLSSAFPPQELTSHIQTPSSPQP